MNTGMAEAQRYKDKVTIVTGGSKGIGRGCAEIFGKSIFHPVYHKDIQIALKTLSNGYFAELNSHPIQSQLKFCIRYSCLLGRKHDDSRKTNCEIPNLETFYRLLINGPGMPNQDTCTCMTLLCHFCVQSITLQKEGRSNSVCPQVRINTNVPYDSRMDTTSPLL